MFPFIMIIEYYRQDEKRNENANQFLGFHGRNGWFSFDVLFFKFGVDQCCKADDGRGQQLLDSRFRRAPSSMKVCP